MRIVSPFKDYYDWVVGKYGMDEKIVYERKPYKYPDIPGTTGASGLYKPPHMERSDFIYEYIFHFCDKRFFVYYVYKDWYFGEEIMDVYPERYNMQHDIYNDPIVALNKFQDRWRQSTGYRRKNTYEQGEYTDMNEKLRCPVILNDKITNPRLGDFSFGSIVPPEDAFITISNWLSKEKVIPDNQTNKEKIISHGFDVKTSFRKM